jgi:hypothetical protein
MSSITFPESSIMLLESSIMLLESAIMLPENIYSTGITQDDHNMFMLQTTGVEFITYFRRHCRLPIDINLHT